MVFFALGSIQLISNISFFSDTTHSYVLLISDMLTHYVIYNQMMKLVISSSVVANSKF